MSDLIERLRKHSDRPVGHWEDYANATDSIVCEAADALAAKDAEIARLQDALRPFADVADFMDSETEGFSMTDCLQLVVQNEGFPTVHVNSFCLQRFYTARAALTQPDAKSGEDNA